MTGADQGSGVDVAQLRLAALAIVLQAIPALDLSEAGEIAARVLEWSRTGNARELRWWE